MRPVVHISSIMRNETFDEEWNNWIYHGFVRQLVATKNYPLMYLQMICDSRITTYHLVIISPSGRSSCWSLSRPEPSHVRCCSQSMIHRVGCPHSMIHRVGCPHSMIHWVGCCCSLRPCFCPFLAPCMQRECLQVYVCHECYIHQCVSKHPDRLLSWTYRHSYITKAYALCQPTTSLILIYGTLWHEQPTSSTLYHG